MCRCHILHKGQSITWLFWRKDKLDGIGTRGRRKSKQDNEGEEKGEQGRRGDRGRRRKRLRVRWGKQKRSDTTMGCEVKLFLWIITFMALLVPTYIHLLLRTGVSMLCLNVYYNLYPRVRPSCYHFNFDMLTFNHDLFILSCMTLSVTMRRLSSS